MKSIGLLGGMSWESTLTYYKLLNEGINQQLGGLHSAKILLNSVDFHEIEALQHQGHWEETATILTAAAQSVEQAGAEFLMICTNTMHKVAPQIEASVSIPLLHIADATGEALIRQGITKVGLLGTAFTMEQDFYKQRLVDKFGIEVLVPNGVQRKLVHNVIYNELCRGTVTRRSKHDFQTIIDDLSADGAQGVILGCTEIGMLVSDQDASIPVFDTTKIHTDAAIALALS